MHWRDLDGKSGLIRLLLTVMQLDFSENSWCALSIPRQKKKNVLQYIFLTVKTLVLSSVQCGTAILFCYPLNDVYLFTRKWYLWHFRQFQNHTVGLLGLLMWNLHSWLYQGTSKVGMIFLSSSCCCHILQ